MRESGWRHHHGDTMNKLPTLLVGSALDEAAKLPERHARRDANRCAGHYHSPSVTAIDAPRRPGVYAARRAASTLHSPPPATAKYKKTKQYSTASSPWLSIGKKPCGACARK